MTRVSFIMRLITSSSLTHDPDIVESLENFPAANAVAFHRIEKK